MSAVSMVRRNPPIEAVDFHESDIKSFVVEASSSPPKHDSRISTAIFIPSRDDVRGEAQFRRTCWTKLAAANKREDLRVITLLSRTYDAKISDEKDGPGT